MIMLIKNKLFGNGEETSDIKRVFTIFFITLICGFILTILISNIFHGGTKNIMDDDYFERISHKHRDQNTLIADKLYRNIRVLCLVTTYPGHKTKAKYIKETWGSRCNHLMFITPIGMDSLRTFTPPGAKKGRSHIWNSIRESLKYIHENYGNKYDYLAKTDDNTYVIMENLRHLLETESPEEPKAYGFRYNEDGITYLSSLQILSRESVKLFVERAYTNEDICNIGEYWDFDKELGRCLQYIGVEYGETLDADGRERVFPFSPRHHMLPETMVPSKNKSYLSKAVRRIDGIGALSDYAVSFHSLNEYSLIEFDYLIYHLRPFGIIHRYSESSTP